MSIRKDHVHMLIGCSSNIVHSKICSILMEGH